MSSSAAAWWGVKEVSREAIRKYSSLKVEHIQDNYFRCTDMVEKPQPGQEFSLYSILGRCVLPAGNLDILDNTPPGAGGEIQLTDAMATLARRDGMTAVDFTGKRYDMGNKLGIMQAGVEVALNHPEIGEDFRAYLKELCKTRIIILLPASRSRWDFPPAPFSQFCSNLCGRRNFYGAMGPIRRTTTAGGN